MLGEEMYRMQKRVVWKFSTSPQIILPTGTPQLFYAVNQMNHHQNRNATLQERGLLWGGRKIFMFGR